MVKLVIWNNDYIIGKHNVEGSRPLLPQEMFENKVNLRVFLAVSSGKYNGISVYIIKFYFSIKSRLIA